MIKLPKKILINVRASEGAGHWLYSQGCAMFRCKHCNATGYLDEPRSDSPLLAQCPNKPVIGEPSPY